MAYYNYRQWTHDEIDMLWGLLERNPPGDVIAKFLDWQDATPDRDGLDRTREQVARRVSRLRPNVPRIEGLSFRQWADRLGVSRHRLSRVFRKRGSKPTREAAISTTVMRRVIEETPYILSGGNLKAARETFGDDFIDGLNIPRDPHKVAIRNVETGEVFDSTAAAARKYFTHRSTIADGVRDNRPVCGYRWERV